MPLYQYVCPSGHTAERIRGFSERRTPCACGQMSVRAEVNRFAIVGSEPYKETRADVRGFQEASMEVDYHYTKAEDKGMPVKRPNLWKEAKKRAAV